MTDNKPLVSVVIPTYNRADLLNAAIQSVLAQTFTDYEIIVVDDGSTDHTAQVAAAYGDQVSYIQQKNAGPAAARNKGVEAAQGVFIAFLDSDDLFNPEKLEKQLLRMNQGHSIGLVYSYYDEISSEGHYIGTKTFDAVGQVYRELLLECQIATPTVMVRREVLQAAGLSDEVLWMGEDIETWLRVARLCEIDRVPESLTQVRVHPDNMVRDPQRILDAYLYISHKHFTQIQPQPFVFRRQVYSKVYARAGQYFLSAQTPQLGRALICWLRATVNNPLSRDAWALGARLAFRGLMPDSVQRWRRG